MLIRATGNLIPSCIACSTVVRLVLDPKGQLGNDRHYEASADSSGEEVTAGLYRHSLADSCSMIRPSGHGLDRAYRLNGSGIPNIQARPSLSTSHALDLHGFSAVIWSVSAFVRLQVVSPLYFGLGLIQLVAGITTSIWICRRVTGELSEEPFRCRMAASSTRCWLAFDYCKCQTSPAGSRPNTLDPLAPQAFS